MGLAGSPDHVKVLVDVEDGRRIQVLGGPWNRGHDPNNLLLQLPVLGVPVFYWKLSSEIRWLL